MIAITASARSTLVIVHRSRTAKEEVAKTAMEIKMVGTTGFEPATSRTPSVRATRLRYVPTGKLTATGQQNQKAESGEGISTSKVSPPFEQRQESAQRIAQIQQHFAAKKLRRAFRRMPVAHVFGFEISFMLAQKPPRARDEIGRAHV